MYICLVYILLRLLMPCTVIATAVAEEGLDFPVWPLHFLEKRSFAYSLLQIAGLRSCRSV
jgi:hypothetical protein